MAKYDIKKIDRDVNQLTVDVKALMERMDRLTDQVNLFVDSINEIQERMDSTVIPSTVDAVQGGPVFGGLKPGFLEDGIASSEEQISEPIGEEESPYKTLDTFVPLDVPKTPVEEPEEPFLD